ncbi:putative ribonuclease H-like domain-containing protein [Tanacetum coccineum]
MEFESAHSNTTAKLPILKLAQEKVLTVTKMSVPVTAEEKTNKKNDVKARSLLLMALPNEHQLTFSQYTDAKTMFVAIKTRFGGSRRFLPPEWNTHVVVWMNKAEIETMSIDDLYNNFKIVEQSVKKSVGASSGAQNLAFMTAPSTSSTNDVNTAKPAYEVSTVSPNVNTASPQVSTASFSDNVVYAFMVENPNGSNLLQQDLEQIHEDDLEAMDLKWQLSLLSMRAKRYYQRTCKKIFINANDTAGYDKSKVECFNCHKMGHFARECRAPRNKEGIRQHALMRIQPLRGLATVKEQLITYRKNEVLFSKEVAVLKREVACKDYEIKCYGSENSKQESNVVCDKKSDDSKENSDDSLVESVKPKDHEKPVKKSVRMNYNYTTKRTHPNTQRNMVPRAVLMKTSLKTFNTARTVNTAPTHPKSIVFSAKPMSCFPKIAQSTIRRPFQTKTTLSNKRFTQSVNTARPQAVNTAMPKIVKIARPNFVLADSKLPTTFWAEASSTACYVQNRVLVVKPHNKTPYELFRGLKPALSFMRPFGFHVTILNTLDNLGKFDGKSDEGTQGELNVGASTQKEEINQDCILKMVHIKESDEKDKSKDDSSPKEVNAARQHVNTASPKVNTGRFKLNIVDPLIEPTSIAKALSDSSWVEVVIAK